MNARAIAVTATVFGGLGVVLGTFGAHALKSAVGEWGLSEVEQMDRLATWEVAVRYQMYHALALLAAAWLRKEGGGRPVQVAAVLMIVGILIFSGFLYAYVLSGVRVLGAIVPIGGTALIVAWCSLAIGAGKVLK